MRPAANLIYTGLNIPQNVFTPPAESFFQLVIDKLRELRIEPHEAREYFRQLTDSIRQVGFIPPLILNLLRDVNGNYQTLIISQNLSPEDEEIIAACFRPFVVGSNEVSLGGEPPTELVPASHSSRLFPPNPLADIYNTVLHHTQGNAVLAQQITNQARTALIKLARTSPVFAVNQRRSNLPPSAILQANPQGILAYLHKLARQITGH
jgi:hypothetical protein